ncbi:hypothetical protein Sme01_32690 [Sphaerisporangium melleum]|uniref:Uncharacterized protein n=1 Tax=Sphaerisporangium melleum TaxID=321316 RepID=A0A917RJR6_9ACTN|nr:hypothetical protein [Sphaerisporangium melleum]GGL09978.1 hypothetical protein GCM10007964_60200 [Sphaerisporangium melleum]GII70793.1 hypothetical protein Sme01_32690 [Sphaerisporangium melleum]
MDAQLKAMWSTIPPATPEELAGARQRLLDGMRPRRRVVTGPRLLIAAGVAAAALVAAPLLGGAGTPAYAVTESPDGTITVTVNELHDPAGLQARLGAAGIRADVTFLAAGEQCAPDRFAGVDETYGGPAATRPRELRSMVDGSRSAKATQVTSVRTIRISPRYIRPGETLVVEFRDNQDARVPWRLGAWLAQAGTSVAPCTPVDDPH